ncbi:BON domain-containing protein [Dokdonella soli]|uniref:BON domain-containing protein n=1 Tax=Dokdonella soli TaxID=529810 RepID=A0ABP3TJX4_9GAMM
MNIVILDTTEERPARTWLLVALAGLFSSFLLSAPRVIAATADLMDTTRCDGKSGDAVATAEVESRLRWSSLIDANDMRVLTIKGTVELHGIAHSETQKTLADRLASDTYGVVGVNNQLDVVDWAPITDIGRAHLKSRAAERQVDQVKSDPWITGSVKSMLASSRGIGRCDIDVKTLAGVVSLRGMVASSAARDLAVEFTTNTLGVRLVEADELVVH